MKIKNEVRYALQIVYYLTLHRDKDIISSNEISAEENIPRLWEQYICNSLLYCTIPFLT